MSNANDSPDFLAQEAASIEIVLPVRASSEIDRTVAEPVAWPKCATVRVTSRFALWAFAMIARLRAMRVRSARFLDSRVRWDWTATEGRMPPRKEMRCEVELSAQGVRWLGHLGGDDVLLSTALVPTADLVALLKRTPEAEPVLNAALLVMNTTSERVCEFIAALARCQAASATDAPADPPSPS
jgi:hypothetical protein